MSVQVAKEKVYLTEGTNTKRVYLKRDFYPKAEDDLFAKALVIFKKYFTTPRTKITECDEDEFKILMDGLLVRFTTLRDKLTGIETTKGLNTSGIRELADRSQALKEVIEEMKAEKSEVCKPVDAGTQITGEQATEGTQAAPIVAAAATQTAAPPVGAITDEQTQELVKKFAYLILYSHSPALRHTPEKNQKVADLVATLEPVEPMTNSTLEAFKKNGVKPTPLLEDLFSLSLLGSKAFRDKLTEEEFALLLKDFYEKIEASSLAGEVKNFLKGHALTETTSRGKVRELFGIVLTTLEAAKAEAALQKGNLEGLETRYKALEGEMKGLREALEKPKAITADDKDLKLKQAADALALLKEQKAAAEKLGQEKLDTKVRELADLTKLKDDAVAAQKVAESTITTLHEKLAEADEKAKELVIVKAELDKAKKEATEATDRANKAEATLAAAQKEVVALTGAAPPDKVDASQKEGALAAAQARVTQLEKALDTEKAGKQEAEAKVAKLADAAQKGVLAQQALTMKTTKLTETESERDAAKTLVDQVKLELKTREEQIAKHADEIAQLQAQIGTVGAEAKARGDKDLKEAHALLDTATASLATLQGAIATKDGETAEKLAKAGRDLEDLRTRMETECAEKLATLQRTVDSQISSAKYQALATSKEEKEALQRANEAEITRLKGQIESLTKKTASQLVEKDKEITQIRAQEAERANKAIADAEGRSTTAKGKLEEVERQLGDLKQSLAAATTGTETTLTGLKEKISNLENEKGTLITEKDNLAKIIAENNTKLEALAAAEESVLSLRRQLESITVETEGTKTHLKELEDQLRTAKESLATANAEVTRLQHQLKLAQTAAATGSDDVTTIQQKLDTATREKDTAIRQVRELTAELTSLTSTVEGLKNKLTEKEGQLNDALNKGKVAEEEIARLTEALRKSDTSSKQGIQAQIDASTAEKTAAAAAAAVAATEIARLKAELEKAKGGEKTAAAAAAAAREAAESAAQGAQAKDARLAQFAQQVLAGQVTPGAWQEKPFQDLLLKLGGSSDATLCILVYFVTVFMRIYKLADPANAKFIGTINDMITKQTGNTSDRLFDFIMMLQNSLLLAEKVRAAGGGARTYLIPDSPEAVKFYLVVKTALSKLDPFFIDKAVSLVRGITRPTDADKYDMRFFPNESDNTLYLLYKTTQEGGVNNWLTTRTYSNHILGPDTPNQLSSHIGTKINQARNNLPPHINHDLLMLLYILASKKYIESVKAKLPEKCRYLPDDVFKGVAAAAPPILVEDETGQHQLYPTRPNRVQILLSQGMADIYNKPPFSIIDSNGQPLKGSTLRFPLQTYPYDAESFVRILKEVAGTKAGLTAKYPGIKGGLPGVGAEWENPPTKDIQGLQIIDMRRIVPAGVGGRRKTKKRKQPKKKATKRR